LNSFAKLPTRVFGINWAPIYFDTTARFGHKEILLMKLTPREKDKLLVSVAAMVARGRLQRGVRLNYPEAIALITDFVFEGARDGRQRRGFNGSWCACGGRG
jgi:hypothetical protein